jgi:hypothetical protein
MHSKSASGWTRIRVSGSVHRLMKRPHTFPYPDSLVATTTSEQAARTGPGNAFALGLVALEDADAFPFASCRLFAVFVVSLALPDANICIEGCGSERRTGRRPCDTAHGFCVSGGDGCMQRETGRRVDSIRVQADRLVRGASC